MQIHIHGGVSLAQAALALSAALAAPVAHAAPRDLDHRTAAEYGAVAADFDGDGRDDISVRTDGGAWRIDLAHPAFGSPDWTFTGWPGLGSVPLPADYDGDGRADLCVAIPYVENGQHRVEWRFDFSRNGLAGWERTVNLSAAPGMRLVPADYDGDGRADLALKGDDGVWRIDYARPPLAPGPLPGRTPPPGAFDGFGAWDAQHPAYGSHWAEPAPADYDGDGSADLAVKDDFGFWYIDYAEGGFGGWDVWGLPGYGDAFAQPVPADYDGDGHADLAVKRDGTWYIDYADDGFGAWDATRAAPGGAAARPVPGNYDGLPGVELAGRPDCGPWYLAQLSAPPTRTSPSAARIDWPEAWRNREVVTSVQRLRELFGAPGGFEGIATIPTSVGELVLNEADAEPIPLQIGSCVQLRGTRGRLDPGALLVDRSLEREHTLFSVVGHDVRIEGLRFQGPTTSRDIDLAKVSAIAVGVNPTTGAGVRILVSGSEFFHWTGSGVDVFHVGSTPMTFAQAAHVSILRSYFHDNARDGAGYGVQIGGGYALVEGNLFDANRHAVAGSGSPSSGYLARYNYVLEGGYKQGFPGYWNQHFDMHGLGEGGYGGIAGERIEISSNTIRGEQTYGLAGPLDITRPAFMLRGRPTQGAAFDWNVVVHDDLDAAVKLKDETGWDGVFEGWDEAHSEFHFTQTGNTWDTDTTADLAVGDFDGDGLDDVFLANGTGWWYSSAGQTEWRFLRASRLRASALRFGQFDADPRTDVFSKEGDAWYFYPAATGARQLLRADATSLSDLLFGDFDGNGRTDVLWTTGSHWYIYADARGPAWWQKPSGYRAGQLRVGDFDGGGRDDVFGYVNGTWSYWRWNQTGSGWERLNGALTTSVEALAVADFDGDGRDDVAQGYNGGWRWSRSGSAAWAYIRPGGVQSEYSDVRRALLGRFNFDSLLDAIRYELVNGLPGTRFVGWDQSQPEFTSWTPAVHHR